MFCNDNCCNKFLAYMVFMSQRTKEEALERAFLFVMYVVVIPTMLVISILIFIMALQLFRY